MALIFGTILDVFDTTDNLAQNGTKLGRVGWPQCVGPKILGRGWTHQLTQASLERNLDICGPFFDVWFTKVET